MQDGLHASGQAVLLVIIYLPTLLRCWLLWRKIEICLLRGKHYNRLCG